METVHSLMPRRLPSKVTTPSFTSTTAGGTGSTSFAGFACAICNGVIIAISPMCLLKRFLVDTVSILRVFMSLFMVPTFPPLGGIPLAAAVAVPRFGSGTPVRLLAVPWGAAWVYALG